MVLRLRGRGTGKGEGAVRDAIGIDPDSEGFVCAQVKASSGVVTTGAFATTEADLARFVRWVKRQRDTIVAIEGANGLSRPIEGALREAQVVFYSFRPSDCQKFRKAVLGQGKDNQKDAEAVARYAMAMESQGRLERWRRLWFPDTELQLLSRSYERRTQAVTAEVSRLWKIVRHASPELYLALKGRHPDAQLSDNIIQSQGILSLLAARPNVGEWKSLSQEEMRTLMGPTGPGREQTIREIRKVAGHFRPVNEAMALLIGSAARQIRQLKRDESEIERMLKESTKESAPVQALDAMRGIATLTATGLVAEIIDIRRFASEDKLASYSGLGRIKWVTGRNNKMVPSSLYNHRLKDLFLTAAGNFVLFNPDSHLAGYHRHLLARGMSEMEARKRVARALVRLVYKTLSSLLETESEEEEPRKDSSEKAGESGMASGSLRSGQSHKSNMPLSARRASEARGRPEVKRVAPRGTRKAAAKRSGKKRPKSTANA
jgi:transposase